MSNTMPRTLKQASQKRLYHFLYLFAAATLLFSLLAYALGSNKYNSLKENVELTASYHLNDMQKILSKELYKVGEDTDYVSEVFASVLLKENDLSQAEKLLEIFVKSHQSYAQVRLLDLKGMEIVRINNVKGRPEIVPAAQLQDKGKRYYFQESRNLGKGEVYISAFDLNIEHGKVERPYNPMLRFVQPVFGADGKKRGYAVINYSGKKIIAALKEQQGQMGSLLLNKDAYYMIGFMPTDEWGFMFGGFDRTFKAHHPECWEDIKRLQKGRTCSENYVFIFSHFYPEVHINGTAKVYNRDWVIVSHLEKRVLYENLKRYLYELLFIISPYYLLSMILCWLIATYIVRLKRANLRINIAHQAFEHASEGIMVTTPEADIVQVNKGFTQITGYLEEEVIGKNARILHAKDLQPKEFYEQMWQALKTTGEWDGEIWNRRKDGTLYLQYLTISSIKDSDGSTLYYIGLFSDITRYREQEEQLRDQIAKNEEQHHKMLQQSRLAQMGEMLSMIAHQWRQPLASISAISGTLSIDTMMDQYDKKFFQERLEAITDLSDHLSLTIDDFRSFFKEDKKREQITQKSLVNQSIQIIGPTLESKSIALHSVFESDEAVETYPNEVKQVLLNILKNAEDALIEKRATDAQIRIRSYLEDATACLSIEDNAGGIPDDVVEKVFEPYFTTKKQRDGTGLGLYMSKTIIEEHCGGSLSVANTEEGARFIIKLPRSKKESDQ